MVGAAVKEKIADGTITRKDLFVISKVYILPFIFSNILLICIFNFFKVWNTCHSFAKVEESIRNSLARLGLDYLDLYLIHFPVGFAVINIFGIE